MKSVFITMLVIICFITAMVFSANNTAMVNINYFVAQGNFNVSHVIGVAFILGFVICWLIFLSFYVTLKFKLRLATKKLDKLNQNAASTSLEITSASTAPTNV